MKFQTRKTLEAELWRDVLVKSRSGPTVPVLFQEPLEGISSNLTQVSTMTGGGADEGLVVRGQRSKVSAASQNAFLAVTKKYEELITLQMFKRIK